MIASIFFMASPWLAATKWDRKSASAAAPQLADYKRLLVSRGAAQAHLRERVRLCVRGGRHDRLSRHAGGPSDRRNHIFGIGRDSVLVQIQTVVLAFLRYAQDAHEVHRVHEGERHRKRRQGDRGAPD